MTDRRLAVLLLAALGVAGCATRPGEALPVTPALPAAMREAFVSPTTENVAGTYDGSIKEVISGETHTGTLDVTIKQSGTKISGSFDIIFAQGSLDLTLSGEIKSQKKTTAKLAFTLYDPKGKRYGTATATVRGKKLKGNAVVPPSGTHSEIKATFKAKRKP
jgi:hypothetical protein